MSGAWYRINVLFRVQVDRGTMAAMQLFLLTTGLTLLSVVQAGYINRGDCATTDKVRSLGGLKLVTRFSES